MQVELSK